MKKSLVIVVILGIFLSCNPTGKSAKEGQSGRIPTQEDLALAPPFPTFKELVGISPLVYTGIVSGIRYGNHKKSVHPFTFVEFKGVELIKNKADVALRDNGSLEISFMGGLHPDLTISEVEEFPEFELGQRYLVFIRGGGWKLNPIAGNTLGVYKLHGSLKDDPLIMTTSNHPLRGIENDRFVLSKKVKPKYEREDDDSVSEKRMSRKNNNLNSKQIEELEKKLVFKDKDTLKEKDIPNQLQSRFDTILKLSDLVNQIKRVESTLDQKEFEKFQQIFLSPIATKGEFAPKSPKNE